MNLFRSSVCMLGRGKYTHVPSSWVRKHKYHWSIAISCLSVCFLEDSNKLWVFRSPSWIQQTHKCLVLYFITGNGLSIHYSEWVMLRNLLSSFDGLLYVIDFCSFVVCIVYTATPYVYNVSAILVDRWLFNVWSIFTLRLVMITFRSDRKWGG